MAELRTYYAGKIEAAEAEVRDRSAELRRLEAARNALNGAVRAVREELTGLQEPGSYVGEVVKVMGAKKVLVKVNPEGKYVVEVEEGGVRKKPSDDKKKPPTKSSAAEAADEEEAEGGGGGEESEKEHAADDKKKPAKKKKASDAATAATAADATRGVDRSKLVPGARVALRNDSYALHVILPNKVDPLVSLMKVEKVPDSTYEMIGGLDRQIREIKEVIELPIKHPEIFDALGIAQPKGVLLYGPPGTGKTLLARAVAHHTDCTFIRVSGSELVQKYIGEGSRMVRELFVMAREHAPSIIFMDEIDSIGSSRLDSGQGSDSEVQRTMLELLNQLDGFESTKNIKVLMATNRIDILDPALLRPGRIDRKIEFPNPNELARLDILQIHSRRMNLTRGIQLKKIADQLNGASGAECKAVCTEAGMFALRERRVHVTQEDFEMAVAKVTKKDGDKNMSLRKLWK